MEHYSNRRANRSTINRAGGTQRRINNYLHNNNNTQRPSPSTNSTGNPLSRAPCRYFNSPTGCFKGKDCRFSHDLTANPQSDHTNIPDSSVRSSTDISDTTSSAAESSSTTATTMDSATDMCSICLEEVAPNKFGLLVNCSHVFCLDCIRKWRNNRDKDEDTLYEGTNKKCPICRKHSEYVIPSLRFHAHGSPAREAEINKYLANTAKIPCRYFNGSPSYNRFCPFGNDCHYSHDINGRRYVFTQTQLRQMKERREHRASRRTAEAMVERLFRPGYGDGDAARIFGLQDMANLWRGMGEDSDDGDDYPIPFITPFWDDLDNVDFEWRTDDDLEDETYVDDEDDEDDEDDDEDIDDDDDDDLDLRPGMAELGRALERVLGFDGGEEDDEESNPDMFGPMPGLVSDSEEEMPPLVDDTDRDPIPSLVSEDEHDGMPELVSDDNTPPPLVSHDDGRPPLLSDHEEDPRDAWTRDDWGPNPQTISRPHGILNTDPNSFRLEIIQGPSVAYSYFQQAMAPSQSSWAPRSRNIPSSARIRVSPPRHIPPPGRRRPRPPRVRQDLSRPRYVPRSNPRPPVPPEDNPWAEDGNTTNTETDGEISERERLRMRLSEELGIHSPTWVSRNQDLRFFNP